MPKKKPKTDINSWRRLYAAADQIIHLAPWQWMEETDVFGVQFPDTDEIGYVSVMGNVEEHFAVTVLLGDAALSKFWDIQSAPQTEENAERILEMPQIMASFESRDMLEQKDMKNIKQLGKKYKGPCGWPLFRAYRPGFYPWFLEQDEIENLTIALEQTVGMAMRFEDDPEILTADEDFEFLVRVSKDKGEESIWIDTFRMLPEPETIKLDLVISKGEVAKLLDVPKDTRSAEVGFFLAPGSVGEPGQRPSFTYMLMAVEPESFFILGTEILQALNGIHEMWEEIPRKLVDIFNSKPFVPKEIHVSSPKLFEFLAPVFKDLGIGVSYREHLPALEDAKESMREIMFNRK